MNPAKKRISLIDKDCPRTGAWAKIGLRNILLLAVSCVLSSNTLALPEDKQQPIHISANNAKLDRKQRTATYTGDVKLTQGTLEITADLITIHTNNDDEMEKMEARGKPARYRQQPAQDQSTITAQANNIRYTLSDERLVLTEEASLEQQNGASISGNRIDYDIRKEVMKAAGKLDSEQRIEIIIPPQTINKD